MAKVEDASVTPGITEPSSIESALAHVQKVSTNQITNNPVYKFLLSDATIDEASRGSVKGHLVIGPNHVNSRGSIHGTTTAAIVDWSGSLAIASHGMETTGPSVDMHITYIGTAVIGDIIQIAAVANKVGNSLGFTTITITKVVDGKLGPLVATASHTKYIRKTMMALNKVELEKRMLI